MILPPKMYAKIMMRPRQDPEKQGGSCLLTVPSISNDVSFELTDIIHCNSKQIRGIESTPTATGTSIIEQVDIELSNLRVTEQTPLKEPCITNNYNLYNLNLSANSDLPIPSPFKGKNLFYCHRRLVENIS